MLCAWFSVLVWLPAALSAAGARADFPERLSELGVFTDLPSLTPAADLVAYDVTVPLWRYGISPATVDQGRPPTLGPLGWYSRLFGSADGKGHWLLGINILNRQSGVFVQSIALPALAQDSVT